MIQDVMRKAVLGGKIGQRNVLLKNWEQLQITLKSIADSLDKEYEDG